jgi:hypothetical protein
MQISSRNKDNPKIGQQRTILRLDDGASANPECNSAVLTMD